MKNKNMLQKPIIDPCQQCGRKWKVISWVTSGDSNITEQMLAHDCEGIGVLALYEHRDTEKPVCIWEIDSESFGGKER